MVVFPLACIENSVSYCTNTISNHAALFWGTSHHPYQTAVKCFLSSHLFFSCNVTVVAARCITLCMVFSDYVKHLQWNKVFCVVHYHVLSVDWVGVKGSWTCRKLLGKPRKHKSCSAVSTWRPFPRWRWNWRWIRLFLVPWIYCISQQSFTWGLTACPKSCALFLLGGVSTLSRHRCQQRWAETLFWPDRDAWGSPGWSVFFKAVRGSFPYSGKCSLFWKGIL